jgi:hypothetical protein
MYYIKQHHILKQVSAMISFNSLRQAWHLMNKLPNTVWSSFLESSDTTCLMMPSNLPFACSLFLCVLPFKLPHTPQSHCDRLGNQAGHKAFSPQKCYVRWSRSYCLHGWLHHLAERTHITSSHPLNFQKMVLAFVKCSFLNLLCLKIKLVRLFLLHWWHTTFQH